MSTDKVLEKLNRQNLTINRVPPKTKIRFIELANEDHCSDYGLTLKYLLDVHDGMISVGSEELVLELEELKGRVSKLEAPQKEKKPSVPKRMDGSGGTEDGKTE